MAINWQVDQYRYRRYFTSLSQFYKTKKVQTYAGLTLTILTITFFLVFAIRPTLKTIAGLIRQIDDHRLVTNKLQEKINALSQAQKEYSLVEGDLYLLDQALPQDSQLANLAKQLETLAQRSNITLENVKFGQINIIQSQSTPPKDKSQETKTEKAQAVEFSLNVSGSYPQLKEFLNSLSSLRRIILINSFGFKKGKGDQNKDEILTLNLEARSYYLKEND